ncbi:MAG TPA: VWA domain-containing protein [Pyrinomonadaceae bacterium]|nr:VWA domain-containing protein [Pyrinomonadaceae bacterium]
MKAPHLLRLAVLSGALVMLIPFSGFAQTKTKVSPTPTPEPRVENQDQIRVFTEEVRLPVSATDTYGHYDPALEIDDVLVLEDGQPQQIRSIQHLPANVLLLLDTGNELGLKDTRLTRDVAIRIISALHTDNRIAIMQFATRPELLQSWTTDRSAIDKVLKTKLNSGKSSRLANAIAAASDQFKDTPAGTRHIVLITDGVNAPGGQVTMTSALKQLNSMQVSVHIVSYTVLARQTLQTQTKVIRGGDGVQRDANPASNPVANGDPTLPPGTTRTPGFKIVTIDTDVAMRRKRKEYERATRASEEQLVAIAEESGGRILLPDSIESLLSQVESISRDIGSQYVITYRPTRPLASAKSGEYRRVEVASKRVGLHLRSRQGYVVP